MESEENMGMAGEEAKGVVEEMLRAAKLADRTVLEASGSALLSYIRAYKEHTCRYLLKLEEMDIKQHSRVVRIAAATTVSRVQKDES